METTGKSRGMAGFSWAGTGTPSCLRWPSPLSGPPAIAAAPASMQPDGSKGDFGAQKAGGSWTPPEDKGLRGCKQDGEEGRSTEV